MRPSTTYLTPGYRFRRPWHSRPEFYVPIALIAALGVAFAVYISIVVADLEVQGSVGWIDRVLDDAVRFSGSDLLDVHAALRAGDQDDALGRPIDRRRQVVFLPDVQRFFDEQGAVCAIDERVESIARVDGTDDEVGIIELC